MYNGLSKDEASARLDLYGPNQIPRPRFAFFSLLSRQLRGVFNILLVTASLVTLILGEPIDAGLILLFVLISIALNLFQEFKSNTAAEKLRSYLVETITIRRGNKDVEIPIEYIVPGDILKLESGDIVPADATIRHAQDLTVNESTFTGESVPVTKSVPTESSTDSEHTLLQGSIIVRGLTYAEVTATGEHTRLAQIAAAASSSADKSGFNKDIDRISGFILKTTLITLLFVVLANVFIEGKDSDIIHLLIFAIALAVSVIPEALPLVMTFSLSRGALRLAKKHVIVKRLASIQDLGSIDLLCADKTGTITENRLVYQNDYLIPGCPWHPLALSFLTAHDLRERHPEPFDQASTAALTWKQREIASDYSLIEEESFDPTLRSNGAILKGPNGQTLHIRRGSPEYFIDQGIVDKVAVETWLLEEETKGHRVLGLSYDDGSGMRFAGFISFADILKKSTSSTIKLAQDLGVKIVIITGDSVRVAAAIGHEAKLIQDKSEVIEAADFFALPPEEQLGLLPNIRVFARTTPEQKLSLITLLKERYTVGFLGEGINDAPALKAANVSMVVKSASDVARASADIVLLHSDLHVIIEGIQLGRETHANTLKYIRTTLVSNFGNFYAVAIGSLFISFLPMLPKQLLLLNLLSDFPMMAIAFDQIKKIEIAKPQRYDLRSLYIVFITLGLISTIFDFMWFALFFQEGPAVLQTNWFIGSVLTEILLVLSLRSMLPLEKAGPPAPLISWLCGGTILLTLALPLIPVTARFFEFTPPTLTHLFFIVILSILYLITTELVKRPVARFVCKH